MKLDPRWTFPDMSETSRLVRLYRDALRAEGVDATDEQAARRLPRVETTEGNS